VHWTRPEPASTCNCVQSGDHWDQPIIRRSIATQEVRLSPLATAAAHCASCCSTATASAAAFSAAVLWDHLVLAMAERDYG